MDLNATQVKWLQNNGFSPADIRAYQLGTATPNIKARGNMILANNGQMKNPVGLAQPRSSIGVNTTIGQGSIWDDPNRDIPGEILGSGALGNWAGPTGNVPQPQGRTGFGTGRPGSGASVPGGGGTFGKTPPRVGTAVKPQGPGNIGYNIPGLGDNPYGMPEAPGAYNFNIPTVEMRDFTEQAKKIAADAFAPYLAAFDIARTNAQAQGATSKEATKGLYDNFVKDIAAKAAETAQRYDQTKAEQATRGEAQQADIAENQQSANANVGQQLGALGLETSAPEMLQQGANNQAYAQDQAAAGTESQQQFYDSQKLAQGNYDSQFGLLKEGAGIGAQQDLDSQLLNLLANIDINKANASGQQSTTALELAQTLANRDLEAQRANAGYSLQGQGMEADQIQQLFGNQMALHNTAQGELQQDWENELAIGNLNVDAMAAQAKAGGQGNFDMSNYPGASRALGILINGTGDEELSQQTVAKIADAFEQYRQTNLGQESDP